MNDFKHFLRENLVSVIASIIIIATNYAVLSSTVAKIEKKVNEHELRLNIIEKTHSKQNAIIETNIAYIQGALDKIINKQEKIDDLIKEIYLRGQR